MFLLWFFASAAVFGCSFCERLNTAKFPDDFLFGVATSSYQIEGAWNKDGKGESVWDHLTHSNPDHIADKSNGDIACDSYNKYKEDVQMLKELGVDYYRFSLSWPRILPTGFANGTNQLGINYYKNLIKELRNNNIEPVVTLFHWDLPTNLQILGGWTSEYLADYFVDYCNVAFEQFGDDVKFWITFNEPYQICEWSYGDSKLAPAVNQSGVADYLCSKTLLKAHAKAYRLYQDKFKAKQNGKIGMTFNSVWFEPASNSTDDKEAAERMTQFYLGWMANPVYGSGDYPEVMKTFVGYRSEREKMPYSRLPELSSEEVALIKGTYDFLGLNYYTTRIVQNIKDFPIGSPNYYKDIRVGISIDPIWQDTASPIMPLTPWGLRKTLNWVKDNYNDVEVYIMENGYPDHGEIQDEARVISLQLHMSSVLDAIEDGVKVKSFTIWSLMDNFEWTEGYRIRFGLYSVDFNDPNRPRKPKLSAHEVAKIVKNRRLPEETYGEGGFVRISLLTVTLCLLVFMFLNYL